MKKIIFILLLFLSCSKDDANCNCTMKVYVSDGNTTGQYFINNVESDCDGNVISDIDLPDDHFPTMKCE